MIESNRRAWIGGLLALVIFGGIAIWTLEGGPSLATAVTQPQTHPNADAASAAPAPAPAQAPPQALLDTGEFGENIYDFAKIGDWGEANRRYGRLKSSAAEIHARSASQAERDRLEAVVERVGAAISARDRLSAMEQANQLTVVVADMLAPFHLRVPVEITKLDFYGRELEVWSAMKDETRLRSTVRELRTTWDAVRPVVESRGGGAAAKHFAGLVSRVEAASSFDEYARVATPFLDDVDVLEGVFENN